MELAPMMPWRPFWMVSIKVPIWARSITRLLLIAFGPGLLNVVEALWHACRPPEHGDECLVWSAPLLAAVRCRLSQSSSFLRRSLEYACHGLLACRASY